MARGWQYHACAATEAHNQEHAVLPPLLAPDRALLLSQQGPQSSRALTALPTSPAAQMRPLRFLAMLRRRLRLPLAVPGTGRCGAEQDPLGDHRAACAPSGLLKLRAGPVEKAWGQVCEEAGPQVLENQFLRDMGLETAVTLRMTAGWS